MPLEGVPDACLDGDAGRCLVQPRTVNGGTTGMDTASLG
jgi:hypothetical protein